MIRCIHGNPENSSLSKTWSLSRRKVIRMVSLLVISLVVLALSTPTFAIETMNMFRATQSGTSTVAANTWTNALCLANDSTDAGTTRDMLVVASFSQSSNGGPTATSTADYQLVLKDVSGSTFSNSQQRFLSGGSDEGMACWPGSLPQYLALLPIPVTLPVRGLFYNTSEVREPRP